MSTTLLIIRLLLCAVFLVAGLAKLADRPGTRAALAGFGLPEAWTGAPSVLLPLAELAVAAALLPASSARWGALGALALLALFVAAIARSMARGEAPDCHCFGQIHSQPAGWRTLARNLVLAALAAVVVARGHAVGPSALAWLGDLSGEGLAITVEGAVIVLLATAGARTGLALLRQNGRLLLRIDALEAARNDGQPGGQPAVHDGPGLPLGAPAPSFSLSGVHGETATLESLRAAGRPVLLLFGDPGCGPCNALMPTIGAWQQDLAQQLSIALISRGAVEDNRAKSVEHGINTVLLQADREVAESFGVNGTPGAVLVDTDGRVASPVAEGSVEIEALVARATAGGAGIVQVVHQPPPAARPPAQLAVGEPAPAVELRDDGGRSIALAERGRDTLLLFWDPQCGFCEGMLGDLRRWEESADRTAPRLVVISRGSAEAHRAMGLRAAIAADPQSTAMQRFVAPGTPSAVLIDVEGRIASGMAVGAPAVFDLIASPGASNSQLVD